MQSSEYWATITKLLFIVLSFSLFSLLPRRRMQRLGASKITQVDFLPREMVSYSKETQTPLTAHLSEGEYLCVCASINIYSLRFKLFLGSMGHQRSQEATKRFHVAMIVVLAWLNLILSPLASSHPVNLEWFTLRQMKGSPDDYGC